MRETIAEGYELFHRLFSHDLDPTRELIAKRIEAAKIKDPQAIVDLQSFYQQHDRAESLFSQMRSLDKQWVDMYPFFEPLEIIDCLKDPTYDLSSTFTLPEKPLERLKVFYSDCFETLGRLLVIAACYEGICGGFGAGVPSRKRVLSPAEFELMANGSKPDLLSSMPFWPAFDKLFDSKLRNGIGHHSWRYDAASDSIHYQNHSPSRGIESFHIPYLDFCIHTRRLYHSLTAATRYLHSVWI